MAAKSERLDIRVSSDAKHMLQEAAEARHKTLSEFVLDSAMSMAEKTLLDQRVIQLSPEQWTAFHAALDAPPQSHKRLDRLMDEPSVFE